MNRPKRSCRPSSLRYTSSMTLCLTYEGSRAVHLIDLCESLLQQYQKERERVRAEGSVRQGQGSASVDRFFRSAIVIERNSLIKPR